MTQVEAFEANLSRGGDSCVIRSKFLVTPPLPVVPSTNAITYFNPGGLGSRQVAASSLFSSFRIKEIIVKFTGITNSTVGENPIAPIVVGVLDDATGETDSPNNIQDLLELRCSASYLPGQLTSAYFRWTPVDNTIWYKTFGPTSDRFVTPGILFAGSTQLGQAFIEIDATVVYKGAVDTLATFELPNPPTPPVSGSKLTIFPNPRR